MHIKGYILVSHSHGHLKERSVSKAERLSVKQQQTDRKLFQDFGKRRSWWNGTVECGQVDWLQQRQATIRREMKIIRTFSEDF